MSEVLRTTIAPAHNGAGAALDLVPARAPAVAPDVAPTTLMAPDLAEAVAPGALACHAPSQAGLDLAQAASDLAPTVTASPSLAEIAAGAGLERIHIVAWRDLEDAEAGGSEVHASMVAEAWAAAGLDVVMRTSRAVGKPTESVRDGYRVVRKSGRYGVFPRSMLSGLVGRAGPRDGLVEVWNGMPFLSPLWAHCPSIVFLHHVHAEMWRMVIKPPALARVGELIEYQLAPPLYRRSRIVTLSESSRDEIVSMLGLPKGNVTVVPPGVLADFTPSGARSPHPLVVSVGRLVPVKRFDRLIDTLVEVRRGQPTLEAVIVGEGTERRALEARISAAGAGDWLLLPGRLDDAALVGLYRKAWVLASTSAREGWGMTITEAGACGTPAVASDIAGHRDAIEPGLSGLLAADARQLHADLARVLADPALRARLGAGALQRAQRLTWDATARGALVALAEEASRRRSPRRW